MKTAISIPDDVFQSAESLAVKLNLSRSELYVMALQKFLKETGASQLTQKVNEFLEKYGDEQDQALINYSAVQLSKVEW